MTLLFGVAGMQYVRRGNPLVRNRASMKQFSVGAQFEHIALDIVGPLPENQQGNRYILVFSDYFTRWVEAFAMANQEARFRLKV